MSLELPEQGRELKGEARELILLFQRARVSQNSEEQLALFQEFYNKLMEMVTPVEESVPKESAERVRQNVNREPGSGGYLSVGSGTSGQRIFFRNAIYVENEAQAQQLGRGAKTEKIEDKLEMTNEDGAPRWMHYPKPGKNDGAHGERYWKMYMARFGNEMVDLLQELK